MGGLHLFHIHYRPNLVIHTFFHNFGPVRVHSMRD
jgi:hypothetical protein